MGKFKDVIKSNIIKTIYFNFKMLPLKQAIRLPVVFYGRVCFRSLKGIVSIKGGVSTGMIKIGVNQYVDTGVPESIWIIDGIMKFNGPMKMARGSYIHVAKNATLSIGSVGTFFGSNLRILCWDKITFGNSVRITWDCQFYDTSFHYIESLDPTKDIKSLTKPVSIGDRVWIGNRTTISKGAMIPDDTIVASNSLVNKDFSDIGPYCMLAGMPAVVKTKEIRRIFDVKKQTQLDKQFGYQRHKL